MSTQATSTAIPEHMAAKLRLVMAARHITTLRELAAAAKMDEVELRKILSGESPAPAGRRAVEVALDSPLWSTRAEFRAANLAKVVLCIDVFTAGEKLVPHLAWKCLNIPQRPAPTPQAIANRVAELSPRDRIETHKKAFDIVRATIHRRAIAVRRRNAEARA